MINMIFIFCFLFFAAFLISRAFGSKRLLPAKSPVVKPSLGSVQSTGDLSGERVDSENFTAYYQQQLQGCENSDID